MLNGTPRFIQCQGHCSGKFGEGWERDGCETLAWPASLSNLQISSRVTHCLNFTVWTSTSSLTQPCNSTHWRPDSIWKPTSNPHKCTHMCTNVHFSYITNQTSTDLHPHNIPNRILFILGLTCSLSKLISKVVGQIRNVVPFLHPFKKNYVLLYHY